MTDNCDACVQSCGGPPPPPPPPQRARAAVFFDGTGNNRANARSRDTSHLSSADRWTGNTASYESAPSNIAKGEETIGTYPGVDNDGQHYYIEGIGTQTGGRDIPQGMMFGEGYAGVPAKMLLGLQRLIDDVASLDPARPIEYVHIDSFGFSRGAAAARHFVYVALNHPELNVLKQLTDRGFSVGEVVVKFVGLYDTVASYGIVHSDDTADLNLSAISSAEYTFQLAAGEEHRKNFRLTDISSAPAGRQIYLPGVHSDIGGGYNDRMSETNHQVVDLDPALFSSSYDADRSSVERERQWLIDRNWYTDEELSQPNKWWEVHGNRSDIRSTYANLALNMMADEARPRGVPFLESVAIRHPVPSDPHIKRLKAKINASIALGNVDKGAAYKDYWLQRIDADLNAVRHKYFHMSACYGVSGGAYKPNYTDHPSHGGVRSRVVQAG